MKYYSLQILYAGPTVNIPGETGRAYDSSRANLQADKLTHLIAAHHNVPIIHAYAWPDGSLFKYIMSNLEPDKLRSIFTASLPLDGEQVTIQPILRQLSDMEVYTLHRLSPLVTIEEDFAFLASGGSTETVRARLFVLHDKRWAEMKSLPEVIKYRTMRDECGCMPPCHDCWKIRYVESQRAVDRWRDIIRRLDGIEGSDSA